MADASPGSKSLRGVRGAISRTAVWRRFTRTNFYRDAIREPKIGKVTAWVLTALILLIVSLTRSYSRTEADAACQLVGERWIPVHAHTGAPFAKGEPVSLECQIENGAYVARAVEDTIRVEFAWGTLVGVTLLAWFLGFQPILWRVVPPLWRGLRNWRATLLSIPLPSFGKGKTGSEGAGDKSGEESAPERMGRGAQGAGRLTIRLGFLGILTVIAGLAIAAASGSLALRWLPDFASLSRAGLWAAALGVGVITPFLVFAAGWILLLVARLLYPIPATLFSAIDWLFARKIGWLAGTTIDGMGLRYLALAAWLFACVGLALPDWDFKAWFAAWGLSAPHPILPAVEPFIGPTGVIVGSIIVLGVVRRWLWIEDDRAQYVVVGGANVLKWNRIGFDQDLRDEALVALTFLFLFIPLGLRQFGSGWFEGGGDASILRWLEFFGAELAKAVPLVDWSEVFGVSNGSPIKPLPAESAGATAVFVLRVTLDILLIGSVLQAFQIVGQLFAQRRGFDAGDIDLLDPFEERREFALIGQGVIETPLLPPHLSLIIDSKLVDRGERDEPIPYERKRLIDMVGVGDRLLNRDPAAIRGAAATLARVAPGSSAFADRLNGTYPYARKEHDREVCAFVADTLARAPGGGGEATLGRWLTGNDLSRFDLTQRAQSLAIARAAHAAVRGGAIAAESLVKLAEKLPAGVDVEALVTLACAIARLAPGGDRTARAGWAADRFPASLQAAARAGAAHGHPDNPGAFAEFPKDSTFTMGSPDGEASRQGREGPQRQITFAKGFAIARFALTFEEYDAYCDAMGLQRPSDRGWGRGRQPVINVSWNDICGDDGKGGYLAWLNERLDLTGKPDRFRLSSEAEWEFACRAGSDEAWSFGDDEAKLDEHAWFIGNAERRTYQVGEKLPNDFGLFDMHGNVREWCQDRFGDYRDAPIDGSANTSQGTYRVLRGGSWNAYPRVLRSAFRVNYEPAIRGSDIGFRLARTLVTP